MNILRQETEIHKNADKVHAKAQDSGDAYDYIVAAQLYEYAGDWDQARVCREAAESLGAK